MILSEKSKELANIIRNTDEYKEVMNSKLIISKSDHLLNQVTAFQRKQDYLYRQNISGKEMKNKLELLRVNFLEIYKQKEVKHYIDSLQRLNKKVQSIGNLVMLELEKDIKI